MKDKNHALHFMQLDEVRAFLAKLLGSQKVAATRCQSASAAGNIEAIESSNAQLFMKEGVGLFLKTAVGAGYDKGVRPVWRPFRVQ